MTVTLPEVPSGQPAALHARPKMRGMVEGLRTPRPLVEQLPAALQEDGFCQRLVSGLDEVIAPILATLDCFDSYLDPRLAPDDFAEWLASWVGLGADETWLPERRRSLIQEAVALYRVRGTAGGLAKHIALYAGVTPEIEESGGCSWSQTAGGPMPGSPRPHVTVRLQIGEPTLVKESTVRRIVDASRPAHLPYRVEILVGDRVADGPAEPAAEETTDGAAPGAVDLPGSERIELAPQAPLAEEETDTPPEGPAGEGEPDD